VTTPLDVLEGEAMDALIAEEYYHHFPGRVVCCLVLESGFSVVGASGFGDDKANGRLEAGADARRQLWEMDAYMVAEALSRDED
jgi:hypothetical protein